MLNDHVAVPSRVRSGTRWTSARMRRCSPSVRGPVERDHDFSSKVIISSGST